MSNIGVAFGLNVAFTLIELVGGYLTNSMAIMADALHDLGDSISLGSALFLEKIAGKKRDRNFSYGYRRFSLLAAVINGLVLTGGSIYIITETATRLANPQESHAPGMIGLALLGIIFNGLGALRLRSGNTMNERLLTWHFIEDILGWVAVLIAGVVMLFIHIPILDPILAMAFTIFILWNVLKNSRQTLMIFLQSVPASLNVGAIEKEITELPEIHSVHDTHVWSLDGAYHVLTTHAVIADRVPDDRIMGIKRKVREIIHTHKVEHATIEVEREDEQCHLKNC